MTRTRRHDLLVLVLTCLMVAAGTVPAMADSHQQIDPPVTDGDVLISNHSFEDGLSAWTLVDHRGRPTAAECRDSATTTDQWADQGDVAVELSSERGCPRPRLASAEVPVREQQHYTAFASVTTDDLVRLALRWVGPQGRAGEAESGRFVRRDGIIEVSGQAPSGTTGLIVEIETLGQARVDRILVTAPRTLLDPQITSPGRYFAMGAGHDENDRAVTFSVATGNSQQPAELVVTDVLTSAVTRTVPLPGATGSWTVRQNPVDGVVYIGTYSSAALWSYLPGAAEATRIGPPPVEEIGFVYGLSFGTDGTVYGGGWGEEAAGFAGAVVWSFHPETGFTGTIGPNPLTTDANYTRWTGYDEVTDAVYTGTGTTPHLYGCPVSGEAPCVDFIDQLSPEIREYPWVYGGTADEGYLMAWAGDSTSRGNDWLVVLKVSRNADGGLEAELVKEIRGVIYNGSTPVIDGKIYYNKVDGERPLHVLDLETGVERLIPEAPAVIFSRAWEPLEIDDPAWPGTTVVGLNSGGILVKYNIETQKFDSAQTTGIPEMARRINALTRGPDGRIWSSGFLPGGLAAVTPMRDDLQETFLVGGQAEAMTSHRDRVYQGTYPDGEIRSFDPDDINAETAPELECEIGDDQNRPYGLHGKGDRIYYGSQADYGFDQGSFGYLDLTTGECTTMAGALGNQSINTITSSGSKVFGGGSIFYSYDGLPIDEQAKLLIFDEATDTARSIEWPVPGTRAINASVTSADQTVWFLAAGNLVAMDPESEQILLTERLFDDLTPGERIGGNYARMTLGPDGLVYGTVSGRLFSFDPRTTLVDGSVEPSLRVLLESGAGPDLALDRYGNVYVPWQGARLLRINPN